ncbi:C-C chemokine receptor type 6 [Boleophthalmus pectinirostris]|uniref:C-C chemokine receptor type 6 n=1 Tax=Boleophthalmus pectinirostris TaxID=150288 RepID=UPI000A1C5381|nr:C-C chemokine receptor type 6 [Boleophthalmus pectinirostris]
MMTTEGYEEEEYYSDDEPCNLTPNPQEILAQTYIHSFICAFGLIGNTLVIATYVFYKRTKTMTDVYLFNVAVVDLIFVVALPFIIYNEQNNWWMGSTACKILRSTYSINLYCGMLLLACIGGDRYIAIVLARRSFGSRSQSLLYSRIICSVIWVFALFLTLPTFIYTESFPDEHFGSISMSCELSFDKNETAKLVKILVPSLQMSIGFLLPFLIMVFCYTCVLITLLRAQSSQRHKAIRVIFAVVVVFILCHLPYNLALLKHTLSLFKERSCAMEKIKFQILAIFRSVAYLHCCLNPILYAFVGVKFRSHFRQIMVDLWCLSKKYIYNARTSRNTSETGVTGLSTGLKSADSSNMSSFSA